MLQQLNMLRKEMYRGYYILDRFRYHDREEENTKDHQVSNSFAPSKFNPAKRIRFCRTSGQSLQQQLQQVLASLEATIEDTSEFFMFLNSYPRLNRQPYSMHLVLDKCLFNRQMEMEHIMNFLLKDNTSSNQNPGVLPIIGPSNVGKSTLIEHACNDERVRNHFFQIVCFSDDDLEDANMVTLRNCGVIKHQNHATGGERILIIVELIRDINEGAWRRFFGTTHALRVKFFTQEAYWYFFKVRTFGSMDAAEHPKLESIAVDMAMELNGCFMGSNVYSVLLRENFNDKFWSMALAGIREFRKLNLLLCGTSYFDDPWQGVGPAYVRRVNKICSRNHVIHKDYKVCSIQNMIHCHTNSAHSEDDVPMVSLQDFLFGSVKPQGKFNVLAWRSHLPPHYNYIFNCEYLQNLDGEKKNWFHSQNEYSLVCNPKRACRCYSKLPLLSNEEKIQRLERMLLRLAAAIEEADGRRILNHGMLRHVNMLRQDMYRGYYILDSFRFPEAHEEEIMSENNDKVNYSLALSKFNSAKRARIPIGTRRHGDRGELEQVIDNLEIAMADMVEIFLLLNNYPSIHRQPYNSYLFMDKCMFGRQMEMEHIINFLLRPEPPNTLSVDNIGVLPIIGLAKVGKSTLVKHVCGDERVCNHFSRILFLTEGDFREEKSLLTLRDSGEIRHMHTSSSVSSGGERLLVIIELAEDVADDKWTRMCASLRSCISAGSKIIITSRLEKIAKLGTTQPLRLKFLSREAYWYFFKVLAFGSSDPEEHPELASVSMMMFNVYFDHELYKNFTGPFMDLNIMASLIQATFYEGNWLSLHARTRGYFLLRRGLGDDFELKTKCVPIPKKNAVVQQYCVISDYCRVGVAHEEDQEVPKIDMQDVLSGRVAPDGRFDIVLWRSHLPPYYSYIYSFAMASRVLSTIGSMDGDASSPPMSALDPVPLWSQSLSTC
uniref:NB-ARC domain-containing protein n=1 Tax=Oryza meridionalis TaxID=40149 RepID=A0A0E0E6Y7_9ORYZ